jgi:hypothetical protein
MIDKDSLYNSIDLLNDSEILDRIKGNFYSDDALLIATEILTKRGVPVPHVQADFIKPTIPFRTRHPFIFWMLFSIVTTLVLRFIFKF